MKYWLIDGDDHGHGNNNDTLLHKDQDVSTDRLLCGKPVPDDKQREGGSGGLSMEEDHVDEIAMLIYVQATQWRSKE